MNRTFRRLASLFVLPLVLAAAPAAAQKIKVGYWTSGFSLGFGAVMEQMKFAEKEGLDIEWVKFASVAWVAGGFYYTRYPAIGSVPPGDENNEYASM